MVLTVQTTEEIVNKIIIELIANNVDITDFNVGSILRTITEAIANQIGYNGDTNNLYELVYNTYLNSRIDTATSDSLDQIGSLVGVTRDAGDKAAGTVTFKRNSDVTSTIPIAINTLVATTPNDEGGQKQFVTKSGVSLYPTISGETHTYTDGIYSYPLNNRIFANVGELSGYSGVSGLYTFLEDTDFEVSGYSDYFLDTDESIITVDEFNNTSGWSGAGCTISFQADQLQGSGAMGMEKTTTTSVECYSDKTLSANIDISNNSPHLYVKIDDLTTYNIISKFDLYLGNAGITNSIKYTLNRSELGSGFNQYYPTSSTINGSPNLSSIDFVRLQMTTLNTTDTTSTGEVEFDYFVFGDVKYHEGNVIKFKSSGQLPVDDTIFTTTYNPRSIDVGITANAVGTDYNVSADKIIYKVTNLPLITNINNYLAITDGTNIETDDVYRERIKDISSSAGKATTNAIKNAISALDGIRSVIVEDLPLKTSTNEPQIYNPLLDTYKLWNEVVYLDSTTSPTNIDISDTTSGVSGYLYGTDYEISGSNIVWLGATVPVSGATYYTDYQYNHLGHAQVYVFGYASPLSTDKLEEISQTISGAISGVKAAGIQIDWEESTPQYVNVVASITFESGYSLTATKEQEIANAINTYITSLGVGDNVIYNELVKSIMSVTGVYNCVLSTPAADVTVATNKIAVLGGTTLT